MDHECYALGLGGQTGFKGSVVTSGKSLRAALYAAHADLDSVDKGESFPWVQSESLRSWFR